MKTLKNNILKSQKGQITIFIVLVFQVLFVFFAMVTNIGLVVHEKINVQNSADLAAMYGAQKQAEVLNAIAHTNYQIRQAWKLLAFRVRVLGDFGRTQPQGGHPLKRVLATNGNSPIGSPLDNWGGSAVGGVPSATTLPPMVCVNHGGWVVQPGAGATTGTDNICKSESGSVGITLPTLPNINVILPTDAIIASQFRRLQSQIDSTCQGAGGYNWNAAANFMANFKLDVRNKLKRIRQLKQKLENGLDLEGNSIAEGVRRTFWGNRTGGQDKVNITWVNSLDLYTGATDWLMINHVYPLVFFVGQRASSGCAGERSSLAEAYLDAGKVIADASPGALAPYGYTGYLKNLSVDSTTLSQPWSDDDLIKSSIGVEKNPWVAIYSGVSVNVPATKPFMPILGSHNIKAESYAMPFGGSIGPWANNTWPSGATRSSGAAIDPLLPAIWSGDGLPTGEAYSIRNIPNYSRFPGDTVGLGSQYSLSEVARVWPRAGSQPGKLSLNSFGSIIPDQLVNGNGNGQNPVLTEMEALAVAPDLFDLTYYSIEPKAGVYYDQRTGQNRAIMIPDYIITDTQKDVKDQITQQVAKGFAPANPYRVTNWKHLLTGWAPVGVGNYGTPSERFGDCTAEVEDGGVPSNGNCKVGGRVGYSVKVVSKDFLQSTALPFGGEGQSGPLLNPPVTGQADAGF
ncbi:MAG: Tad domain-containing protein [Bdellovibrionota bacterium]|nr:Tad domain-containing protein [Bdellovibrionota bacterium]